MHGSFTERMQQGRELAQDARNRGKAAGQHASWKYTRPVLLGLDAIEAYYLQWRKDVSLNAYSAVEYALFQDDYDELARIAEWEFGR